MRLNRRTLIISSVFLILAAVSLKMFMDSIYRLPILMYHSINHTSDRKNKMTVSPEAFTKQMKYLHDKGYNMIPLEKAVWYIEQKKRPPPKTVAITMDDGNEDNYKYAYPVLKKYRIPVTMFVIINMVGKESFLNWDEIKEMSDSGVIDIESHTVSHPWLTGIDDNSLASELIESKKVLEEKLGKEIEFLCYPMGTYNERVKSATKRAGYKAAFATKPTQLAPNYDIYEIKRVRISPTADNLFVFWIKVSGYHAFFRMMHEDRKSLQIIP